MLSEYQGQAKFVAWGYRLTCKDETQANPAPFPLELASRLVRMFSFQDDTVLDPFCGSGTTMVASLRYGRNSIGIDIDPEYCRMAAQFRR